MAFRWVIELLILELEPYFFSGTISSLLASHTTRVNFQNFFSNFKDPHKTRPVEYPTPRTLASNLNRFEAILNYCLADRTIVRTLEPHRIHTMPLDILVSFSPVPESPTSVALYSEKIFCIWRHTILASGINLTTFVHEELQRSPLASRGWNEDTLTALFRSEFRLNNLTLPDTCTKCSKPGIIIQHSWIKRLENFKSKHGVDYAATLGALKSEGNSEGGFDEPTPTHLPQQSHDSEQNSPHATHSESSRQSVEGDMICVWCWYKR